MALLFESWLVEFAAVLVTLFAGIYAVFIYRFNYWKKRNVAYVEPSFPFGNIADTALVRLTMGEVFERLYKELDDHEFAGFYQFASPGLMIRDPEYVKAILVKDFAHFHDHGLYFDEKIDPLSAHLFSMEGVKWKHMRYKLTPTFTSGKMKMMFPTLVECGLELQKHLIDIAERKETLEVKDVLAKYSTDVIATCAFGIQSNSLKNPDSEFRRMGRKVFEPSFFHALKGMLAFFAPSITAFLKMSRTRRDITDFFLGVVNETITYRETNNVSRNDFMQLLIKIKNKKSVLDENETVETEQNVEKTENYYDIHGMTNNEVAAQAFVFFIAGFETSSTTMSFSLYELARNQQVQDRLRDEVDSVLADHGGKMTYEAIMEMTYLDRVIAETLRKYSPVSVLFRKCNKEYKMPDTDVVIEKGTSVIIPVQALHNDPQYYPEPEKFDPDRFTEEAKKERHHFVYLPFGEGPRICIGSRFGLMQTKVGLASLIAKYQFNVCNLTPIPLVLDPKSFIASALGGMNLQITARK